MGSLKRLSVIALQHNKLTGQIPASLGNLGVLKRLDLSFNKFFGTIPAKLADIPSLEALDIRSNSLSGVAPLGMSIQSIRTYFRISFDVSIFFAWHFLCIFTVLIISIICNESFETIKRRIPV